MYKVEKRLWQRGFERVAGIDEAGRGPLAGPVVASAVILPKRRRIAHLQDSKQLSASRRESLFAKIICRAEVGVGIVFHEIIDAVNIFEASRRAMAEAVLNLAEKPEFLLVDGRMKLALSIPKEEIIRGDCLSASIAAASIVAKVIRDQIMTVYDELYPEFLFRVHKGYPTLRHRLLLDQHGPSPIHRLSFRPLLKVLEKTLL